MRKGFSLVEILIVLAVLGIALGMGYGSLQRYVSVTRVQAGSLEVVRLIRDVGGSALNNAESYSIEVTTGGNSLVWHSNATGATNQTRTLPQGVSISAFNNPNANNKIDFSGRGLPNTSTNYQLTVRYRDIERTVLVLLSGKAVIK